MVSIKFSVFFWALFVLFAQFHTGYSSSILAYKKDLIKQKLYKLKEALFSHHEEIPEVHHYHYKPLPVYVSSGYKWPSGWSSGWPSYGSYGNLGGYGGWH